MVEIEWWVYLAVLGALVVLSLLLHVVVKAVAAAGSAAKAHGLGALFIGADNRTSTSKLQAFLWTYAVLWALISLLAGAGVEDFNTVLGDEVREEYLLLLGGPFAVAIGAKAITTSRVSQAPRSKPPKTGASSVGDRLAEVVVNDEGSVDLGDFQYAAFTLLTLVYFVWAFVDAPAEGLPEVPGTLLILMGVSQAAYLGKKGLPPS
jgi:hypothetical protein